MLSNLDLNNMQCKKLVVWFLLLTSSHLTVAQEMISGIVKDPSRQAIPGVNVVVKGSRRGVTTDYEGRFQIIVHPDTAVLIFSFIGFLTQEYQVQTNSKLNIEIILKEDCIRCFLDGGLMTLGLASGLINSPAGGNASLNLPLSYRQRIVNIAYGYQTDFDRNSQISSKIGIHHLLYNCHYDVDLNVLYSKIKVEEIAIQFQSYLLEAKINFSRPRIFSRHSTLFLGVGSMNARLTDELPATNETGYMAGYGIYVGGPLNISLLAKAIYWEDFWQIQSQISRQIKRVNLTLQWNHIEYYNELNLGIAVSFNYGRVFQSKE